VFKRPANEGKKRRRRRMEDRFRGHLKGRGVETGQGGNGMVNSIENWDFVQYICGHSPSDHVLVLEPTQETLLPFLSCVPPVYQLDLLAHYS
jgi:hypothetical protein